MAITLDTFQALQSGTRSSRAATELVAAINANTGAVVAAEHGAGAIGTGVAPSTTRRVENGSIITDIKIDLAGLTVTGTVAKDVIGLVGAAASNIGRYVVAKYGVVYRVEMICIEAPTEGTSTITQDIDLGADDGLLAQDDTADDIVINTATLVVTEAATKETPALSANDYLYLIEGDTAASTGIYSGGQFIIRFFGHPVLT